MKTKIGIIGLGYVGLPIAVSFAKKFTEVIGFDINKSRIRELTNGFDRTGEVQSKELEETTLVLSNNKEDLKGVNFYIVAVPTPVTKAHIPDLEPLISATETLGSIIGKGAIVVYESTVYPGVTEEICGKILERVSGLVCGTDFKLGYSPERINPGDKIRSFENTIKVVSGQDEKTLEKVAQVYGTVVSAGVFKAKSIKVAEAAKVIENTQRDLNIALMNELAIIFDKLNIRTKDVLDAASTKWNFVPFSPGLVGGHCIGVDPYYLTYKAEEVGYHPQVILAGRRINDGMSKFIVEKTIKLFSRTGKCLSKARVGILGLTFKEDVPDIRNSRVPDILAELNEYGVEVLIHDPLADAGEAMKEYDISLSSWDDLRELDVMILAVAHRDYKKLDINSLLKKFSQHSKGVFIDVKSIYKPEQFPNDIFYWSL